MPDIIALVGCVAGRPVAVVTDRHMLRQLQLWDVAEVEPSWSVRQSPRARRLSVRVFRNGGVEIVVPPRTSAHRVSAFVSEHREWIERQRLRAAPCTAWPWPPSALALSAVDEHWECRALAGTGRLRLEHDALTGVLTIRGPLEDRERVRRALTAWLIERAYQCLDPPLRTLGLQMGVQPGRLQVRCQRTRWGSCSRSGTISLNACLLFLQPPVLRYLLVHELSHLRHMNHSAQFWSEVARHEPHWKPLDRELLQGWRRVPSWIFR